MGGLARVEVEDLSEPRALIDAYLIGLGWARKRRAAVNVEGQLHYTGDVQWVIAEKEKLWAALWYAVGRERLSAIAELLRSITDEGLRLYHVKAALEVDEIKRLHWYLSEQWENRHEQTL